MAAQKTFCNAFECTYRDRTLRNPGQLHHTGSASKQMSLMIQLSQWIGDPIHDIKKLSVITPLKWDCLVATCCTFSEATRSQREVSNYVDEELQKNLEHEENDPGETFFKE